MSIRAFADAVYGSGQLIRPLARLVAEYARNDDDYFLWEVLGRERPNRITTSSLPEIWMVLEMSEWAGPHYLPAAWIPREGADIQVGVRGVPTDDAGWRYKILSFAELKQMIIAGRFDATGREYTITRAWFTTFFVELRRRWHVAIEG